MNRIEKMHGYRGGFLIGFIIIAVVALRTTIFYQEQGSLVNVTLLLAIYLLLYLIEPWLSFRVRWYKILYFPVQSCLVISLTNLRPFTDVSSLLYIPLCIQVMRAFTNRVAVIWLTFYVALLSFTLMLGLGWLEGLALVLLFLAVCTFLISFDLSYSRTQADQAESQRLLADLQSAHRKLQEFAIQVNELAAARERNRLARELHDSVSQTIFGITFTSQSTRLLMENEPSRAIDQIDLLQEMTSSTLRQLRSLISELRPQPNPDNE